MSRPQVVIHFQLLGGGMAASSRIYLLLIVGVGFALGQEETTRTVREEINDNTHFYNKNLRDHSCSSIMKLYDPNFMLINQDGTVATGLEAIQLVFTVLESLPTLNLTTLSVTPLGRDARFVFQHVFSDARDSNGNPTYTGEFFHIWKRDGNNKLRIAMEIYDEGEVTIHGKP